MNFGTVSENNELDTLCYVTIVYDHQFRVFIRI